MVDTAMNKAFVHLRVRMLVFVLLAFVPALLLTLLTFKEQRREGTDEAKQAALQLARAAAISYERLTVQTQSMVAGLAQLPAMRQTAGAACHTLLAARMRETTYYANIGVADLNGNLVCSAVPLSGEVNVADRSYFWRAVTTADFAVGEYLVDRVTGKGAITFGYPVLDAPGHVTGAVYAALDQACRPVRRLTPSDPQRAACQSLRRACRACRVGRWEPFSLRSGEQADHGRGATGARGAHRPERPPA